MFSDHVKEIDLFVGAGDPCCIDITIRLTLDDSKQAVDAAGLLALLERWACPKERKREQSMATPVPETLDIYHETDARTGARDTWLDFIMNRSAQHAGDSQP